MLNIVLLLLAGTGFVYLAQNNLMPVTLHLGPYVFGSVPLFYVIVGSLLTGLLMSYLIQIVRSVSTAWIMRGKNREIKQGTETVLELTKRVHQLELENEKLKHKDTVREPVDVNAL